MGELEPSMLPEASGLAVSAKFPDRLYHVNDSGEALFFYLTNRAGGETQQVKVAGVEPVDVEDLGLGPCGGGDSCLFIADIGDNLAERDAISLTVVKEQETYGEVISPYRYVRLRYPDGAHNAEALAVHPSGDIYLLTKDFGLFSTAARLYHLPRRAWEEGQGVQTLDFVTSLDLPSLMPSLLGILGQAATALDISADGRRLLVLTYRDALELSLTALGSELNDRDYTVIPLRRLPQQESVAYLPDGSGFIYTSEILAGSDAKIMLEPCLD